MSNCNNRDRERLGFSTAVRNNFSFLENQYGLQCVHEEDTLVRFESDVVFVNVYHGRTSFEIGLEFGRRGYEEKYSLEALVALSNENLSRKYWANFAVTTEMVETAVSTLAQGLIEYENGVLSGDACIYQRLEQLRRERIDKMIVHSQVEQVRPLADAAFRKKNYAEAARLYRSISSSLTEVERRKLTFAEEKQISPRRLG